MLFVNRVTSLITCTELVREGAGFVDGLVSAGTLMLRSVPCVQEERGKVRERKREGEATHDR